MTQPPDITDFLFDELDRDDRAAFEQALADDPTLAVEVEKLGDLVSQLEALPPEVWEVTEPPALAIFDRSVPAAQQSEVIQRTRLRERLFGKGSFALSPALALAATAFVFAAGLGIGLLSNGSGATPKSSTVQQAKLDPFGNQDVTARGVADIQAGGASIKLQMSGLKPNSQGDFYEAWLMDPKNGFVSIGTFRVTSKHTLTLNLPIAVGTKRFPIVDVSLEPNDGKPAHSGDSVLRGTLN